MRRFAFIALAVAACRGGCKSAPLPGSPSKPAGWGEIHFVYPDGDRPRVYLVPWQRFEGDDMVYDDEDLAPYDRGIAPDSALVNNTRYALVWVCPERRRSMEISGRGGRHEIRC